MPTKTSNRKSDGYKLFGKMLRTLHAEWIKPIPASVPDSKLRSVWRNASTGTLRRYMDRAATSHPRTREGFYLAMNDYLGSSQEITVNPEFYERAR